MSSSVSHFADRLGSQVRARGTGALVGLDPRWASLPSGLRAGVDERDLRQVAAVYGRFCREIIDVVAPLVPAVKPQAAFFEQLGPAGMEVLHTVIAHARDRGLLVILDGKRNDIGTTAEAYADAYLGPASAWRADALTVSPYLGDDSLAPFCETAQQRGCGLFVLVKTSNPGSGAFQDLKVDGTPLYRRVAEVVESLTLSNCGNLGYGNVGAVVGATYPAQLGELRQAMPHAWILVPGFGAQGGAAADVAAAFDQQGLGALVNNSRAIIFAHSRREFRDTYGDPRWQEAVEAATREMIAQLAAVAPVR